jgi:hypothetical protein
VAGRDQPGRFAAARPPPLFLRFVACAPVVVDVVVVVRIAPVVVVVHLRTFEKVMAMA